MFRRVINESKLSPFYIVGSVVHIITMKEHETRNQPLVESATTSSFIFTVFYSAFCDIFYVNLKDRCTFWTAKIRLPLDM